MGLAQRLTGLEHLVPELVKKTFAAGMGAVFQTEEGIRKIARDVSLTNAAGYLAHSADGAKDKVFEVIARETREFLSTLNVTEEIAKLLTTLSFEIKPTVKARSAAKPLPLEAQSSAKKARLFDLLEWYQFPAEGEFTVTAVITNGETAVKSKPIVVTLRKPDKKDSEAGPVDRIHHVPWSNYDDDGTPTDK